MRREWNEDKENVLFKRSQKDDEWPAGAQAPADPEGNDRGHEDLRDPGRLHVGVYGCMPDLYHYLKETNKMTDQELMNEYDMLIGNINRMMITREGNELYTMYKFAGKRLLQIYLSRFKEIREDWKKED